VLLLLLHTRHHSSVLMYYQHGMLQLNIGTNEQALCESHFIHKFYHALCADAVTRTGIGLVLGP